jgi:hypothetical protein
MEIFVEQCQLFSHLPLAFDHSSSPELPVTFVLSICYVKTEVRSQTPCWSLLEGELLHVDCRDDEAYTLVLDRAETELLVCY